MEQKTSMRTILSAKTVGASTKKNYPPIHAYFGSAGSDSEKWHRSLVLDKFLDHVRAAAMQSIIGGAAQPFDANHEDQA